MRAERIMDIYKWGIVATTMTIGVATAIVQTRWVMPAGVFIGAFVTVGRVLWKWQDRPYSDEIRRNLRERTLALNLFGLLGSLFLQAITIAGLAAATLSVNAHPCVCLNGEQIHSWFNLTLSGALFFILELVVVGNLALLVYYLAYRTSLH